MRALLNVVVFVCFSAPRNMSRLKRPKVAPRPPLSQSVSSSDEDGDFGQISKTRGRRKKQTESVHVSATSSSESSGDSPANPPSRPSAAKRGRVGRMKSAGR